MKTLKNILEGSLSSNKLDESSILGGIDDILDTGDNKVIQMIIKKFIEENYTGNFTISEKPNSDGLFEVSSNNAVMLKNKKTTSKN